MDGSEVWISQVNDGTDDCPDGEDEMPDMDDDHDHGDMPTFICGDGSEIPFHLVNDDYNDCSDGADEQQYDSDGNEVNWFDCMDGSTIWISEVNDGTEDCPDGEDETYDMEDLIEETFGMMDSDDDGIVTWDEVDAFVVNEEGGWDSDAERDADMAMFNDYDTDSSGGLDADEFAELIMSETYDDDHDDEFYCDDGSTIPMSWVNDGMADCPDGEDEYDSDHGTHDDSDEIVMYITSEMDFYFEGDMSDYKIELAECDYDYDMDAMEETKTCTTVVSVAVADASVADIGGIMFHDTDSSGTISVGDMIHIGEIDADWDEVRLYSISADAYSDESPAHDVPGFTGLVGMLALLGAAFIRRNE
ncbi:MAG: Uncharacterised protein [Euryarchaeota archaeon UBA443]|nr:MAG: Uncharacterised protein [Euryarchaeota archaeon UBA443]